MTIGRDLTPIAGEGPATWPRSVRLLGIKHSPELALAAMLFTEEVTVWRCRISGYSGHGWPTTSCGHRQHPTQGLHRILQPQLQPQLLQLQFCDWSMRILRMHTPAYLGCPRIRHTYVWSRDCSATNCKSQAAPCLCEKEGMTYDKPWPGCRFYWPLALLVAGTD